MDAATRVSEQVNAGAGHGQGAGKEAIPVVQWPGHGPILWGFILRDLEVANLRIH